MLSSLPVSGYNFVLICHFAMRAMFSAHFILLGLVTLLLVQTADYEAPRYVITSVLPSLPLPFQTFS
jgi:hypothetical protein